MTRNKKSGIASPVQALLGWLRNTPITNPVDRRNAVMLQLLMLIVGIFIPVMMAIRLTRHWNVTIEPTGELLSLLTTALAWTCFYLIRTGHFRAAIGLFITGSMILMGVTYTRFGLKAQLPAQVTHVYPLLLGGLLLGRQWLWLIMAVTAGILALGTWTDLSTSLNITTLRQDAFSNFLRSLLGFLLLTIILDRTITALRDTLSRVKQHERDLIQSRDRLQQEMLEKERSQAQLVHSQKVEAVGRLAAGTAHDFNNILGIITGYASRRSARTDNKVAAEILDGILRATERGKSLTQRLLRLTRSDPQRIRAFDLGPAVTEIVPMVRQLLGPDIKLEVNMDLAGPNIVLLDPAEFQLAILNVATNARDAMPDGGILSIVCQRQGNGSVALVFSDDGHGMPTHVMSKVFDPFFTTKPSGAGTGIGLAVVHRTVVDAGGTITVDSTPGQGSTFRITLPTVRPEPERGFEAGDDMPGRTQTTQPGTQSHG